MPGESDSSSPEPQGAQSVSRTAPKDVYPESGFRLPLPKRADLDERGKEMYDQIAGPSHRVIAGLQGPLGILLYDPELAELSFALNQFLRFRAGIPGRVRELAILVAARESRSQFEWGAHEPEALREGIDPKTIDIVRYGRSGEELPERDSVVIELGRQMFGQQKVDSDTFARALKLFGPRGLVNLVSLMGNYYGTAALLATFDMQLRPGQKPLLPKA